MPLKQWGKTFESSENVLKIDNPPPKNHIYVRIHNLCHEAQNADVSAASIESTCDRLCLYKICFVCVVSGTDGPKAVSPR